MSEIKFPIKSSPYSTTTYDVRSLFPHNSSYGTDTSWGAAVRVGQGECLLPSPPLLISVI